MKPKDYSPWQKALTEQEAINSLGYAACALDKIANWTEEDEEKYGSIQNLANAAMIRMGCRSLIRDEV